MTHNKIKDDFVPVKGSPHPVPPELDPAGAGQGSRFSGQPRLPHARRGADLQVSSERSTSVLLRNVYGISLDENEYHRIGTAMNITTRTYEKKT